MIDINIYSSEYGWVFEWVRGKGSGKGLGKGVGKGAGKGWVLDTSDAADEGIGVCLTDIRVDQLFCLIGVLYKTLRMISMYILVSLFLFVIHSVVPANTDF